MTDEQTPAQRSAEWVQAASQAQRQVAYEAGELTDFLTTSVMNAMSPPAPAPVVIQRDDAWMSTASPEQIVAVDRAHELTVLKGGKVDEQGWPLDRHGKRVNLPGR